MVSSRTPTYIYFGLLLAALAVSACNCGNEVLTAHNPGTCEKPDFKCVQPGQEYRLGQCRASRCQIDSDCCPGQKCNAAAGFCADQYVACSDDTQCTEIPGQRCIAFRGAKFCGYPNRGNAMTERGTQTCLSQADCDRGRTCFGSRCVTQAPCNGSCAAGKICDVDSNSCYEAPSCAISCQVGQMLVVADPDVSSGPHCCKVDCKCAVLPPIRLGQYGYYASLGLTRDEVVVSAYDKVYGDLVLAHFGRDGAEKNVEYIDGFPTSGPVVGNPEGPRGGRVEPGPDVGLYTSLAVDAAGTIHVSYYDKTEKQLKYASNSGGRWKTSVVDRDGNVGEFTSLAIGPDGNPRISYMLVEGMVPPDPGKRSALKYAEARVPSPAAPSDWSIQVIDSRPIPTLPCGGSCPTGQACIQMGAMTSPPACVPVLGTCARPCMSGDACVDMAGAPACVTKFPILLVDDLPPGTGLFSSLAFTSTGTALIAFYDRVDGVLKMATSGSNGRFRVRTLDGADPMARADVGRYASLAVGPNDTVAVAYVDATRDHLVYLQLTNGARREIVDNGVTPPDLRMVGPDASLIFDAAGRPAIAYQDPTRIDLLYARRIGTTGTWSTELIRGGPSSGMMRGVAAGFYASQKRLDMKAYISNADVSVDAEDNLALKLSVVIKDLP